MEEVRRVFLKRGLLKIDMKIIIPLIIAILFYKIKLIDDRKYNNFEKFKNYLKRHGRIGRNNELYEQDVWLDKDIPHQLMDQYKKFKNNEGEKRAILDYYKDYKDNESARRETILLIILNTIYLILEPFNQTFDIALMIFSIICCLKQPQYSLFNNPIINVCNNKKSQKIYIKTQDEIEKDILKY